MTFTLAQSSLDLVSEKLHFSELIALRPKTTRIPNRPPVGAGVGELAAGGGRCEPGTPLKRRF